MYNEELKQFKNEYEQLLKIAEKFETIYKEADNLSQYGHFIFECRAEKPKENTFNRYKERINHLLYLVDTAYNNLYHEERRKDINELIEFIKNLTPQDVLKRIKNYYQKYECLEFTKNSIKFKRSYSKCYGDILHLLQMITILQTNDVLNYNDATDGKISNKIYHLLKDAIPFVYKNCKIEPYQNGNIKITFADKTLINKFLAA